MSGFLIALHGPLHWLANCQTITAQLSDEAEIYVTDECVKSIQFISHIINDLNLQSDLLHQPITVLNNNMATVHWSRNKTSKNIRNLQIRKNAVCESVASGSIIIKHVDGKTNLDNIFTKEEKDIGHFIGICDKNCRH